MKFLYTTSITQALIFGREGIPLLIEKPIGIPFQENSYDPDEIVRKSKKLGINSQVGENLENILKLLISEKKNKSKKILITGSLYLVGYFLEKNG